MKGGQKLLKWLFEGTARLSKLLSGAYFWPSLKFVIHLKILYGNKEGQKYPKI